MAEPDLTDEITTAAEDGISFASVDGESARAVPIKELIEADKYLAGKTATQTTGKNSFGILFGVLRPPGSI